jgi:2-desacetyl-2-hydroxyethyl bacteriochlorophyllide A dehydrogenase
MRTIATAVGPSFEAVVIDAPGFAALRDVLMPVVGADEVVIEVEYVGVCGTDLEIHRGTLGYFKDGLAEYPIIPGHEVSGRIAAVGDAVRDLEKDDPVVVECIQGCGACTQCLRQNPIGCPDRRELGVMRANGGYARYLVVNSRFVHRLPAATGLALAALCEPLAVALKGLRRLADTWADDEPKVCGVIGGGPLGRLCASVLSLRGHSVTLFDRDRRRLDDAGKAGFATADALDHLDQFETLIDVSGNSAALRAVLDHSAPGNTVLLLGFPYSRLEFDFEKLVAYDRKLVGSVGSTAADFECAIGLLPQLNVAPFLNHVLPLEEFADAWRAVTARECLKVLLKAH